MPYNISVINGRSHCPSCKKQIRWFDNIPLLSYIILKAKCRDCSANIESKYFIVELVSALSFVFIFYLFGFTSTTILFFILSISFLIIIFIDLKHFIIPNEFILIGLLILSIGLPLNFLPIEWIEGVYGALVFAGFLFFIGIIGQFILKKESIGFGDAKLGLILGGYLGVKLSILALYMSFAISAIIVFILLGSNLIDRKAKIPFGPYLAGGTLLSILTTLPNGTNVVINWYINTMF